jgi:FMN phosphatase YigB (HAD superfamily)
LQYFDFVVTSHEYKTEKPNPQLFEIALKKVNLMSGEKSYHVGNSIDLDAMGAAQAGFTPLVYNEWFDEQFPDWFAIESELEADDGAAKRKKLMEWGRTDNGNNRNGLKWIEIWDLDDVLTLFGFPEDLNKPIRTTYIRGFLSD